MHARSAGGRLDGVQDQAPFHGPIPNACVEKSAWNPGPSPGTARVRPSLSWLGVCENIMTALGPRRNCSAVNALLKGCECVWLLEINLSQCFCALWIWIQPKQEVTMETPVQGVAFHLSGIITKGHSRLRGSGERGENSHPQETARGQVPQSCLSPDIGRIL